MELVVRGRNVEVPEHFRAHVADKLARVERYDARIIRTDVELLHERNPRQSEKCQRVEITCRVRGPVVRAEACAADFYAALDLAVDKIERRFRQAADRRRIHHGRRNPMSLAAATAEGVNGATSATSVLTADEDGVDPGPGHIVREKTHTATPTTIDQALLEMELVGHDFYLFHDAATDRPSVVYRRKAYDYGLIRLGD
ncbi:MAG: ribosome hibernation-promoting factor, HPF/YfiA family [Jatrophihabitans sp.]